MNVEFVRFKASDDVELQGWYTEEVGDTAVIHIHGMSGNGYENYMLDNLRLAYAKHAISFFSIDTRGRGIISDFRQGAGTKHAGSCFELFQESADDIQGAISYLQSRGKTKFILQGHSLGCTKVVNYISTKNPASIRALILLAPTDMVGWAKTEPKHVEYVKRAEILVAAGTGEELVDAQCWLDKTPISAQTYLGICQAGSAADIYGDRQGGSLLGRLTLPTLIAYGDADIGITQIDGSIEKWEERIALLHNDHLIVSIIKGARHSFRGYESELAARVEKFLAG